MIRIVKTRVEKLKQAYNRFVGRILHNTPHHYFQELPAEHLGWWARFLLKRFYRGIASSTEQTATIENIEPDAVIIYANKFHSNFEYLFYYSRYREQQLPIPEIELDSKIYLWQPIGRVWRIFFSHLQHLLRHGRLLNPYTSHYIRDALIDGKCAFLTLVEKKGFYRRFVKAEIDPVQYLIEIQQGMDRPIYIVPHLMFFDRKAPRTRPGFLEILFGTGARPGNLRRLFTLFKSPDKIFYEISTPLNLKAFIAEPNHRDLSPYHLAIGLRRRLMVQFNRHRQSITGPVIKSKEELKESILTNERMRGVLAQHASKREVSIHEVYKEAQGYIDEIAAKYSNGVIAVGAFVVRLFLRLMFDGVSVNNDILNRVKSAARKGPLILVPCHKSHIDYLILSYLFYINNMPPPHVVAGKNLFFWPLGPLFRAAGAFSIRRSFKGAVLYSKVFAEYIHKLLEEGFNIELFIEGGRSRTGKLLVPRLGFLSILLNAYRNNACEDMNFVPIFVGYDRVPEEKSYLHEIAGGKKEPENLRQVIRARKALGKKYGRIYVRIGEPISLKELLDENDIRLQEAPQKTFNTLCRSLGVQLAHAIDRSTVVTPYALVASAALHFGDNRFTKEQLLAHIETLMAHIMGQHAGIADTLMMNHIQAAKHVFNIYRNRRFIEQITPEKEAVDTEPLFQVNEGKRPSLEYYKNNCVSFFIPAAFTALMILSKDAFQFSSSDFREHYLFLQNLLKNEFAFDPDQEPGTDIQTTLKSFIDEAILMPHATLADTYNLTSAGYRKIALFSNLVKPYIEAYWIVLSFLKSTPKKAVTPKDRMKKIQALGQRMYKGKEIERREALSKIYYENGVDFFNSEGIKGSDDTEKIDFYTDKLRTYLHVMSP